MATARVALTDTPEAMQLVSSQRCRPLSKGKPMKKIDVEKDYKRTRFLIVAMVIQIVVVFLLMAAYMTWLRW
jgi:hypothetical protein